MLRNRYLLLFLTSISSEGIPALDVSSLPAQCKMAIMPGLPIAAVGRWAFNVGSGECEQFTYGGWLGNANNFETKIACESTCSPALAAPRPPLANEFYYVFTGDTQLNWCCTAGNGDCLAISGQCGVNGSDTTNGPWSNALQKAAILAEHSRIGLRGLVIVGDLTAFGHTDEFNSYKSYWDVLKETLPLYPTLGNHDYANNVNDCALNNCADRMMSYMLSHHQWMLSKRIVHEMDYFTTTVQTATTGVTIYYTEGSFAFYWKECNDQYNCMCFVMLHNYPAYTTVFDSISENTDWNKGTWNITASFTWLENVLRRIASGSISCSSVVIGQHDMWDHMTKADRTRFRQILESYASVRISAIFFAHQHECFGTVTNWCIGGRPVPLMYVGSVPANNFLMTKFDLNLGYMSAAYKYHIRGQNPQNVRAEITPAQLPANEQTCVEDIPGEEHNICSH